MGPNIPPHYISITFAPLHFKCNYICHNLSGFTARSVMGHNCPPPTELVGDYRNGLVCSFSIPPFICLSITLFTPQPSRLEGYCLPRSGWAGGCQPCGTHISVTTWRIFSVQSSVELSRLVVAHCNGHLPICPYGLAHGPKTCQIWHKLGPDFAECWNRCMDLAHLNCNCMSCNYLLEDNFIKRYKTDKLENSFSLIHVSIQSLNSKLLSLTAYLNTLQTDFKIIGLSESWLNEQSIYGL